MTLSNPISGTAPGLPAAKHGLTDAGPRTLAGLAACDDRLAAWADWFGLDPAPMHRDEDGDLLLDDDLLTWMLASGASIDWLVCGDLRLMAARYRHECLTERRFAETLDRFDDAEVKFLVAALKAHGEGLVPMEDALGAFKAAVEEHRASGRAAACP